MINPQFKEKIITRFLEEEMKESYLSYAMSVIIGRALPDIRDGLKPVQRRILYAMEGLHLRYNQPYKKSARVTGEVLGKYHPHGDSAVYDALVRMAQDFSLRYPTIDGQGNFGSIDGDPAAAMRYSECRMSRISDYILRDIDKDTVNFFPNFDNSLTEPEVLPAVLPNLLCNGASGIAVGMSTNIPPHNLDEVCEAIIFLIDNPKASLKEIQKYIKGPDFPTGGVICGRKNITEMYKKGRGKLTVRAKAAIEKEKNKDCIVISEIPYQLNKTTLLEQIANIINQGKVEGVSDLRDESDRDGIRVVVELKKGVQAEIILNNLYKYTSMETTFGAIFLALVNRTPQMLSLKEMLAHHISFRKEIIVRRTKFELIKAENRAHILEGLKIALKNLDKIVSIIKKAKDPKDAEAALIKEFKLTAIQAQAILQMQLQRLCALERKKIDQEYEELLKKIEYLKGILASQKQQEKLIKEELQEIKEKFGSRRRTAIVAEKEEIEVEDLIVEEEVIVAISRLGYIKRVPLATYRHQKRGGRGVTAMATGETDFVQHLFVASSKDTLLIFTDQGKAYPLKTYEVPQGSRTSRGRAIVNILNLSSEVNIAAVLSVKEFSSEAFILMATQQGMVKRCSLDLFSNARKTGIIAINLKKDDKLIGVQLAGNKDDLVLATEKGLSIRFSVEQARATGRQSQGVRGIKLTKSDIVLGMGVVKPSLKQSQTAFFLTATAKGLAKRTPVQEYRSQSRGGKGIINIKLSAKTGDVKGILLVSEQDEVMGITQKGVLIRIKAKDIRISGRSTQGVKIINLGKEDKLAALAQVVPALEVV